jgi:hypothetical protein
MRNGRAWALAIPAWMKGAIGIITAPVRAAQILICRCTRIPNINISRIVGGGMKSVIAVLTSDMPLRA